ncbi:unnamed protein product, partial [Adineta ricciae]
MKYQRVLYTNKFSSELKSILRIVSYDKRRSLKGNVYYVGFASDTDMAYADRICKRLQNVTMKPFQSRSPRGVEYQRRSERCEQAETYPSAPSAFSPSSSTNVASISACVQILDSTKNTSLRTPDVPISNMNKEQLLNDVQSCLNAVKIAQRAADDISQRFKNGKNCDVILNHLLQVHSTAFYLKATTSFQLKDLLSTGMKLSWPDLASNINEFRLAVGHER